MNCVGGSGGNEIQQSEFGLSFNALWKDALALRNGSKTFDAIWDTFKIKTSDAFKRDFLLVHTESSSIGEPAFTGGVLWS